MTDHSKVVIVTGAGSGIGKASALRFAGSGARVAITDIDPVALQAVSEQITGDGGDSLCILADVSDASACEQAAQQVLSTWGRIDMLVANAGVLALNRSLASEYGGQSGDLRETVRDQCARSGPDDRKGA